MDKIHYRTYNQFYRFLSLLFACTLSICLLTGCSKESYQEFSDANEEVNYILDNVNSTAEVIADKLPMILCGLILFVVVIIVIVFLIIFHKKEKKNYNRQVASIEKERQKDTLEYQSNNSNIETEDNNIRGDNSGDVGIGTISF